jgi:hypothetical protein
VRHAPRPHLLWRLRWVAVLLLLLLLCALHVGPLGASPGGWVRAGAVAAALILGATGWALHHCCCRCTKEMQGRAADNVLQCCQRLKAVSRSQLSSSTRTVADLQGRVAKHGKRIRSAAL